MYAPLVDYLQLSAYTNYLIAFVIGVGFGFFLEQGGFGNSRKLALVFYLRDMTVIKVMFSAIITALVGTVLLSHYNFLDFNSVWINPTYVWGGVVGGIVMGIGFAVGGYCPGTSLVGLVTLKDDAFANVAGAFAGMVIAAEIIPAFWEKWSSGYMGARVTLPSYFGISVGTVTVAIIAIALFAFILSGMAEDKFGKMEK